jgi:SNF2 family DNA or RNA helicase
MDIQAQDRAHRIGQTKPVLIFRIVSKYTIEEKIMQKANEKRKLEALVIAKGSFELFCLLEMSPDILLFSRQVQNALPSSWRKTSDNGRNGFLAS